MKILYGGLAVIGLYLSAGPARPQDNSSARIKIGEMRKALLDGSAKRPDLPERMDEIRRLVRGEVLLRLNGGVENPDELNKQLRPILQDDSGAPVSIIRRRLSGVEVAVVGYSIMSGSPVLPTATAVIEAFRKASDRYEPVASTGDGLEGSLPRLEELVSPLPGELWILAHGQQMQVMQYHEKVRIYSFDGSQFKELWAPATMRSPSFQITKDTVKVTYQDEPEQNNLPLEVVRTILLTPSGALETGVIPKH